MQGKSYATFLMDIRNLVSDIQISDSKILPGYIGRIIFNNNKFNLTQILSPFGVD